MDQIDLERLKEAVQLLESPSWTAKITDIIGIPIEWAIKKLPKGAGEIVSKATEIAIRKALVASIATMDRKYSGKPFKGWHKLAVITSGGIGGFFGLPGLVIELPISTVIMLRSIADIARSEGEKIGDIETQMACVEVFALGGRKRSDDASETGYYGVRVGLATALREAGQYITERGLVEEGAPAIVRLIARIASRYSIPVIDKIAAQAAPILGSAGGATINLLFINHFQSMARGHFIVRNLECKWGEDAVKAAYHNVVKLTNV
jgi:hypothetical protein